MFKSKADKEFEQKLLIKDTLKMMNAQIKKLEDQKSVFLDKAIEAKKRNLPSQVKLAISGYKMSEIQLRRAQEMLLNFEITAQMKDLSLMTSQFLGAMGVLSKNMAKISSGKNFAEVQKTFFDAMKKANVQTSKLDAFMDMTRDSFADQTTGSMSDEIGDDEIEKLIEAKLSADSGEELPAGSDDETDKQIEELTKKINSML
ncbi:MAG: hypothetical protein E7601_07235 [Ruminococcaceae bacterium]|nr:hypothetical protein [Oscillospiraceae bacterium]